MKRIDLSSASVELDDFGFIWVHVKNDFIIRQENAVELADAMIELADNQPRPFVCDARDVLELITPEAGNYLANHPVLKELRMAQAFLITKNDSGRITEKFIEMYKTIQPAKVFESEEKAKLWLLEKQLSVLSVA